MSFLPTDDEFRNLLETKELYKKIFDCSVLPIIIYDMYFNIIEVNDKVEEVFGYCKKEILNLKIFDLHPENELKRTLEVHEQMNETDNMTVKTKFKRKDGSIFTADASPCKINLKRQAFIHVHIQNIEDVVDTSAENAEYPQ